jgi:hypothetical protein
VPATVAQEFGARFRAPPQLTIAISGVQKERSIRQYYAKSKEIRIDQIASRLLLPKLGWIRYRNSRPMLGRLASVTITAAGERWFVSVLAGREVEPQAARGPAIGIDMGVVRFATLSDGTVYTPLNSFRRHEKALAVAPTFLEPKNQVQQQLEKGEKSGPTHPHTNRQCAPQLPAQDLDYYQSKPCSSVHRGIEGIGHVAVPHRQCWSCNRWHRGKATLE